MDYTSMEAFITFCDNMVIAEEGKLFDKFKSSLITTTPKANATPEQKKQ